ncbi:MAG: hypothetical protein ACFB0G_11305 [Leptolyngbyaceae cyanobacterium]
MKHPLTNPLLIGALSMVAPLLLRNAPVLVLLPALPISACGLVSAAIRLKSANVADIGDALIVIGADWLGIDDAAEKPLEALKVRRPESVATFLKGLSIDEGDPTTSGFWTPTRANTSALIVGARGSGKSKLFAYRFQQCVASGVHTLVADLHYRGEDEEKTIWLPQVDDDDFIDRFLIESPDEVLMALLRFAAMTRRRVEGEDKDRTPHHLFIDEFEGYWRRWDEVAREQAIDALHYISHEGRKALVNASLSMKVIKREENGIDSSLVQGSDLYLMGRSLADRSNQVPTDLDGKTLQKERNLQAISIGTPQRALVHIDYLSGEARVVVSPNLTAPLSFELEAPKDDFEAWLTDHRDSIDRLVDEGCSKRQITEQMGIVRSLTNPLYVGLTEYLNLKETKAS